MEPVEALNDIGFAYGWQYGHDKWLNLQIRRGDRCSRPQTDNSSVVSTVPPGFDIRRLALLSVGITAPSDTLFFVLAF